VESPPPCEHSVGIPHGVVHQRQSQHNSIDVIRFCLICTSVHFSYTKNNIETVLTPYTYTMYLHHVLTMHLHPVLTPCTYIMHLHHVLTPCTYTMYLHHCY